MKGVILAGGTGSRLYPNTKVTNKHLLPVYNKPMIYYPIENMLKAGITDILIMPGKDHAGDFAKLLGSGKDFNARFTFIVQDQAAGNAYPLRLIRNFVGDDNFLYIFGDNVFEHDFYEDVQNFKSGAMIFCKQVDDPHRFGVAEVVDGKVLSIEEKPEDPKSNWAVTGAYIFDSKALDYAEQITPSLKGELQVTDINNIYIKNGEMKASFMQGHWYDTGTHKSLAEAAYRLMTLDKPTEVYKFDRENSPKVAVGFVMHNSEKFMPTFVETLKQQDYKNIQFYAVNANDAHDAPEVKYLKEHMPQVHILQPGKNTGFGVGHNMMMRQAITDSCVFYAAVNLDLILEPNFIAEMLNAMIQQPRIASVAPKLKRFDIEHLDNIEAARTNFIDSTGIVVTKEHHFRDRGRGEIDHGQFDQSEEVFGATGAAALYRLSALKDVAFHNENGQLEFYDELMFMYKEDVDLAYRLQWAGYHCQYAPDALGYHARTVVARGNGIWSIITARWNREQKYKEWAWLNHHILLKKLVDSNFSSDVKLKTLWYEIKSFGYILLFEPFLIKQFFKLFSIRDEIRARRQQVKKRIDVKKKIEKWMR